MALQSLATVSHISIETIQPTSSAVTQTPMSMQLVLDFVKDLSFDAIKEKCSDISVRVRELDTPDCSDLYLLVLDDDSHAHESETIKSIKTKIDDIQSSINEMKSNSELWCLETYRSRVEEIKTLREQLATSMTSLKNENRNSFSDLQMACNGVILQKETNIMVCPCFPRMYDNVDDLVLKDPFTLEYCEDGTFMRLFNHNGHWYTATRRCIDAKFSYWSGSRTFDELFWDAIGEENVDSFVSKLSINNTYFFILKHTDNRIVVKNNTSQLVLMGCVDNATLHDVHILSSSFGVSAIVPRVHIYPPDGIHTAQELLSIFGRASDKRGLIITSGTTKYRFDFPWFLEMKELRGNTPYLRTRIVQLLKDKIAISKLIAHYKEATLSYYMVMWSITNIAKTVYKLYVDTHIRKVSTIDKQNQYYTAVKMLHSHYKESGTPVQLHDAIAVVENLPTNTIISLLEWVQ